MIQMKEKGTSDIYLAAAFMAMGAEFNRADKENIRHMVFYFLPPKDPAGLEKYFGEINFNFESIERDWTNSVLFVNATKYKDAIQRLKSVVHSK